MDEESLKVINNDEKIYAYAKINGIKYYDVDLKDDVEGNDSIIYISNIP